MIYLPAHWGDHVTSGLWGMALQQFSAQIPALLGRGSMPTVLLG